jgi:hypothetical protein
MAQRVSAAESDIGALEPDQLTRIDAHITMQEAELGNCGILLAALKNPSCRPWSIPFSGNQFAISGVVGRSPIGEREG